MTSISILIRTIGRLPALKDALDSLSGQQFRDFDVVVVEDGPATLKEFLSPYSLSLQGEGRGEGSSNGDPLLNPPPEGGGDKMNIHYEALGERKGRSTAGNRALTLAKGDYCLFLDEDDWLLPEHLESLAALAREGNHSIVYSWSQELKVNRSADGGITKRARLKRIRREDFSLLHLVAGNFLPINAVLFKRELFDRAGGFDEDIDCLEDWLLWLRFAAIEPEWKCTERATAVYTAPFDTAARRKAFRQWHGAVHERMRGILAAWPVETLNRDLNDHFRLAIFLRKLYYHVTGFIG